MIKRFELLTPAKINLFLRITGRRPDGYHELDSLFLPISLFDRIVIETADARASAVSIRCNWAEMPMDSSNLAVRAAQLFMAEAGLSARVEIDLHKEIPAGAGLGGGSSDAGAVLRAMASMHGFDDQATLERLALKLGADVPFFLDPHPARVGGVGERITYLSVAFRLHLVIGVPPVAVPTAEIYRHLEQRHWSGRGPIELPSVFDSSTIGSELLVNDLEAVATARYPQIAQVNVILQELGALGVAMSGSGGVVFGLFREAEEASKIALAAAAKMPEARFVAVQVTGTEPPET
jgi:4-diphosphocytidyl-2-C-methyl-D-erythritol kinase